ncbi:MAG TPA: hypothetical protein PKK85_08270, partial [Methanobacteriaceae archaeon]|nr:hypothetical protein [Methanobacteriaceae archaeon]
MDKNATEPRLTFVPSGKVVRLCEQLFLAAWISFNSENKIHVLCFMLVRKKRQSLLEKFLRNTRTPFIPEFRLKGSKFRYDIYIPQINTCIDIDSTWYHKSCWSKYRSHIKREIANSSGFTTIHIKDD